jgi:hypothetical protein
MNIQYRELRLPLAQLSYSHMQPIGWKHIRVPSNAPMRETKESNTGTELAMIYATTAMPEVQLSQVTQWVMLLLFRCREPRRMWTKMYFAGIFTFNCVSYTHL